jgi:hypothetical protein
MLWLNSYFSQPILCDSSIPKFFDPDKIKSELDLNRIKSELDLNKDGTSSSIISKVYESESWFTDESTKGDLIYEWLNKKNHFTKPKLKLKKPIWIDVYLKLSSI